VSEFSVEEIIEGIKARDNCVLQYVYKNHFPSIHHFIISNSGSPEDAKDIFQESIIVIYRKLKEQQHFLLNSSFKTFIYSIARNLWLKHLRAIKYEGLTIKDQQQYIELKDEPFKVSNDDLKMSLYQKYFKQLPEDCQNILKLTARDIPQKEIAQAMNLKSENYVKKRKHDCKEKLIEMIKKDPRYPDLWDEPDN
jgi:RNA polymerase sigma factor (sigma-70 family)